MPLTRLRFRQRFGGIGLALQPLLLLRRLNQVGLVLLVSMGVRAPSGAVRDIAQLRYDTGSVPSRMVRLLR